MTGAKRYRYFVAYHATRNAGYATGNAMYEMQRPITDIESVRFIESDLLSQLDNVTAVAVTNYILLETLPEEED